jgi:hypothetical protein
MLRLWLIAMLAAAALTVVRSHHLLHATGLLHSCQATAAPAGSGGTWRSCRKGLLNGRPDLRSERCRPVSTQGSREYWRCPSRIH